VPPDSQYGSLATKRPPVGPAANLTAKQVSGHQQQEQQQLTSNQQLQQQQQHDYAWQLRMQQVWEALCVPQDHGPSGRSTPCHAAAPALPTLPHVPGERDDPGHAAAHAAVHLVEDEWVCGALTLGCGRAPCLARRSPTGATPAEIRPSSTHRPFRPYPFRLASAELLWRSCGSLAGSDAGVAAQHSTRAAASAAAGAGHGLAVPRRGCAAARGEGAKVIPSPPFDFLPPPLAPSSCP